MKNMYNNIERFNNDINEGLNESQIQTRIKQNLVNVDDSIPSHPFLRIIKDNLLTLFNFVNIIIALAIIYTGSYKNLMFIGVVICNSLIGIIQEIRAKVAIDKLSMMQNLDVTAIRCGEKIKIKPNEVVLDDIIKYSPGEQIVADSIVEDGFCELNESLLTGESDLIPKKKGDILFCGSFVSSGVCFARVNKVGSDNYSSKIYQGAKYFKKPSSEIMNFLQKLMTIISVFIIPIGLLLFSKQMKINSFNKVPSIIGTSSALIGMIPEGLVLLTSTALALSVIKLSKNNILARDIYCIESLAKVDTICLDKTGTITEGKLSLYNIIPQNGFSMNEIHDTLNMLTSSLEEVNSTFMAIKNYFPNEKLIHKPVAKVPFSSERKWSGAYFEGLGSYVLGAPEKICRFMDAKLKDLVDENSKFYRVLLLAKSENVLSKNNLPNDLKVMCLILIEDKIRKTAKQTFESFYKNGVDIKIISGDNPITVSYVAKRAGVKNYSKYIDMSNIKDNDLEKISSEYTVFGRVTPSQKRNLISAMKNQGHNAAMIGDGVNDVLALKESDCSIAMSEGSEAARIISNIVLIDSDFSSLLNIISEGQKVINNIQKASSLFLVKTIFSCILAIIFLFAPAPYPFIPIQMTLISSLMIGIPSFFLALENNKYKNTNKNFLKTVAKNAIPASFSILLNILILIILYKLSILSKCQYSTISVILTAVVEFSLVCKISRPINKRRLIFLILIFSLFLSAISFLKDLFGICSLESLNTLSILIPLMFLSFISHFFASKLCYKIFGNNQN